MNERGLFCPAGGLQSTVRHSSFSCVGLNGFGCLRTQNALQEQTNSDVAEWMIILIGKIVPMVLP